MLYKNLLIIALFFILSASASASENEARLTAAQAAYSQALNRIITGRIPLVEGRVMSFVEVNEAKSGGKHSIARQLRLEANGEETLSPGIEKSEADDELNWQSGVLVNPSRFPANTDLISETETTWVFSIPTLIKADVEDSGQSVDSDKVNHKLASTLVSELTVSKQSPRFLSLKTYASEPFNPAPLAKVSEFNVRIEYIPAWENGPLVTESISVVLKGSYAFFISMDEFSLKTYHKFHLVD